MENVITIDKMKKEDWEQVRVIYIEGINTRNATFDTEPPTWAEWDTGHLAECRFVARLNNQVVGWAALSQSAHKEAYHGVAEVSIYVSSASAGKGIGSILLEALIEASEQHGFWTLQALIFPENTASLKLHNRYGFETIGTRKRVGKLHGIWRDVVFLERRSTVVGLD
ncbi:GNAT family N-acetyltransferase [Ornithinibacillus contaminans]|uniref:GNAT family N-acetyltransferase n=1 Tax=Ornithinibacillus contaminans TaxID=694055 RepID=UPI00064DE58D|nr:GNAT family N-acetyltransferase [Ornithinibacillus contaminans]